MQRQWMNKDVRYAHTIVVSGGYLKTKLQPPVVRESSLVGRRRLQEQLDAGISARVILVSAPAGFGKTTLVAEWIKGVQLPVCWYTIDESDNAPGRFFGYVVEALRTMEPTLGSTLLQALQTPDPPEIHDLMPSLVNELAAADGEFILVLDDWHLLDSRSIDDALTFLVTHLPSQMHLVILTREDPPLPLARLRGRGQLTEVRTAQLCFTIEEATELVNGLMGLGLNSVAVRRLNERTEGWVAGLQMAALSLVGREDPQDFIESFAGTHRFIVDYLVDEVLLRHSEEAREFLLQTSILRRMTAPLCNAVTGRNDGQETLERLERNNMLLVPLDDRRDWYRYHQLFADVLRANAVRQRGADVGLWHARASRWHDAHGERTTAISHAFASGDFDLAADIVERTWPELYYGVRPMTWLTWAERIPDSVATRRPVLTAATAWMLLDKGDLDSAEHHLRMAERLLAGEEENVVISNSEEFGALPGSTEAARAYLALIQGDTDRTIAHARRGLSLLPKGDHYWHGTAFLFVGLAQWRDGDLEGAFRSIADSVSHQRAAGSYFYEAFGMAILADIRMAQGRLREAQAEYQRILETGNSVGEGEQGAADQPAQLIQDPVALHAGLGELNRQWGNLDRAEEHLDRGLEIRGRAVLPATVYRLWTARARTRESQGRFSDALADLDEAERRYTPGAVPDPFPIPALRARVWLRQGRLQDAVAWAQAGEFGSTGEVPFLRECEYLTWARIAIASASEARDESALQECIVLLDGLAKSANQAGRSATAIEASILKGIALENRGDPQAAEESIGRALQMAEPEGFVQIFVDEAAVLEPLFARVLSGGVNPRFLKALLRRANNGGGEDASGIEANRLLVEPLSGRELEVLGLINQGRANQAVADELYIALSTVKKHLNNIFGKLGAKSRTEALRRARDLGLL